MAEHCFRVGEGTKLVLVQGDLTAWEGDAIVNAGEWLITSFQISEKLSTIQPAWHMMLT